VLQATALAESGGTLEKLFRKVRSTPKIRTPSRSTAAVPAPVKGTPEQKL